jgi:hypothetical protein
MALSCLVEKIINGKKFVEFNPLPRMVLYAYARCEAKYADWSDDRVAEHVGVKPSTLATWRKEYDIYFEEWLEDFILLHSNRHFLRDALESVGVRKALEGEFNFWKPYAIREKVISPDSQTLNIIPANLSNYDEWTPEQLVDERDRILASLRPMENQDGSGVGDTLEEPRPESGEGGTPALPPGPVALPSGVGSN